MINNKPNTVFLLVYHIANFRASDKRNSDQAHRQSKRLAIQRNKRKTGITSPEWGIVVK
jgi:hypothetical protein